ncbi:MAG: FHA domain-containing protein [Myxococcales bacterium]|nr:FHA domain-containing protein [Myxococcales bacterium]
MAETRGPELPPRRQPTTAAPAGAQVHGLTALAAADTEGDDATLALPSISDAEIEARRQGLGFEGGTIRRVPPPGARSDGTLAPPTMAPLPPPQFGVPAALRALTPSAPQFLGPLSARPVPPPQGALRPSANPVIQVALPSPSRQPAMPAQLVPPCENCGGPVPYSNSFCGACGLPNPHHTPTLPMPQAALKADRLGYIALIDDSGVESLQFPLVPGENRIGSGHDCQLRFPDDSFLAHLHCIVDAEPTQFRLRPIDIGNGVFLRITTPVEVHHGDILRVGQEVLRFERIDHLQPEVGLDGEPEAVGWPVPRGVWGRLCQVGLQRQIANAYLLSNPDVFLGRERGDILFPKDGFVSGSHAVLSDRNGRAFLKDLGSSNGTFVRISQESPLRNGDLFLLGRNLLRVHIGVS